MSNAFGIPADDSSHPALGDVQRASAVLQEEQSLTLQEAAGNLLEKAYRAQRTGDTDRAHTYVHKAAALPWDQHKDTCPAAWEVHQILFDLVVAEMQDVEVGDASWLDPVGEVIDALDDQAAQELRQILGVIGHDYQAARQEREAIGELAGRDTTYPSDPTFGLTPSSSVDEVISVLEPMLRALVAYTDALDRAD